MELHGVDIVKVVSLFWVVRLLRDFRLPGNKFCAHEVEMMAPLLRYCSGLKVFNLSNNILEVI